MTKPNQQPEVENFTLKLEVASLQAQKEKYRNIIESMPDNTMSYDLEGRVVYMNMRLQHAFNVKLEDVLGKTFLEVFPVEKYPHFNDAYKAIKHVIATGESAEVEHDIALPGEPAQIHIVRFVPGRDAQGVMYGVIGTGQDVTKQRELENNLRKKEQEFRTLADNFPYMVIRYDTELRRVYVNQAYLNFMNLGASDILGKSIDSVWTAQQHLSVEEFKSNLKKVIDTKAPHDFFVKWQDENGDFNFREMLLVPEFDAAGNVLHILAIGHNTNMYEKAVLELRELNTKLQMLSAKKETAREEERKYIAREVHDELSQLLGALHLHASTIHYLYGEQHPEIGNKAKSMMAVTDRAVYAVRHLISQLRPANIEHGLIFALKKLVETLAGNTGITYQLDLPESEVEMDEARASTLLRIVQESFTNIMRHSGASFVTVKLSYEDCDLCLSIKDNGRGFNHNETYRSDAFGIMGMQERALALSGKLEIISQPGCGTEIKLQLSNN